MIADMLNIKNITIIEQVQDWREAIRVSLQGLVKGGYVEERYIDSVIQSTIHYGAYYILCNEVALIHGRPEDGVKNKQVAITLLKNPVSFLEDGEYSVRLLVALAATDSNSHLDIMKVLVDILSDKNKMEKMLNTNTVDELYRMFLITEKEMEE